MGGFLEASPHKLGKIHFNDFHIDLVNPVYNQGGLFSSKGGVIWAEGFRLQATEIFQKQTPEGSIVEAKGEVMLFLNGYLLTGDHLVYNLSNRSGHFHNSAIGFGNWCVGGRKITLFADQSIQIEKAWISSDPSTESSWKVAASRVVLEKSQRINFKNLSIRFFGLPVFILPRLFTTVKNIQNQPVDYDFVWKGSKKRKIGLRYRFYESESIELWTRLEYLIGRGPGVGVDASAHFDNSKIQMNNFVARDSSIVDPNLQTRYRFKGHYEKPLSDTASFNIFYDRYSDSDFPSDYPYLDFDHFQQGETKIVLRDQKPSFIHQVTQKVKINPFQTVKKQLPSYFYTPHSIQSPWNSPWENWMSWRFQARAEYLSYDFHNRSPFDNYHSSRLSLQGFADIPMSKAGLHITPSVGYKISSYNQSNTGTGATVVAPTATLNAQMTWIQPGVYTHSIEPFARTLWVGNPLKSVDEHYVFDQRDAITKQLVQHVGVSQTWHKGTHPLAGLTLQSIWIKTGQETLPFPSTTASFSQHFELQCDWYVTDRWHLVNQAELSSQEMGPNSWNIRSEHTWSKRFANSFEFRTRNSKSWRKSSFDDFSLESYRNPAALSNSPLSDPRKTILSRWIYRPTPNWAFRFDTAHGWKRENSRAYAQYCMGISTDLSTGWRLQFQISKTPEEWDWRIRIDLRDTPVIPPKPQF